MKIAEISHQVAKAKRGEIGKFESMDLCEEIVKAIDGIAPQDHLLRETLRDWIASVQNSKNNI